MDDVSNTVALLSAAAIGLACYAVYQVFLSPLAAIPTVGTSIPLLTYRDAFSFMKNARTVMAEGYRRHKGGFFKVAMPDKWMVIISGPMVEELRRLPDEKASFLGFSRDALQGDYTTGSDVNDRPFHVELVQSRLTKTLANVFGGVYEEIERGFTDLIPDRGDEWVTLPAMDTLRTVVCRASNRIFVGSPLCRDPGYMRVNMQFAVDTDAARHKINMFPRFMKPLVGPYFSKLTRSKKAALHYLQPVFEERLRLIEEYGPDYPDKPDDLISWMLDVAEGPDRSIEALTRRVLAMNFAAIHTSTSTITHVVYDLAANPELFIEPLREEVERVVSESGWTKVAMTRMHKIDSFIKESTRLNTFVGLAIMRKMWQAHTFSDGTYIPKGTLLGAPTASTHMDESNYDNPLEFNPWRFSDMRVEEGEGVKHQFVNTSPRFIPFGHGKHACPGRFFAANELKLMLAYLVLQYDVKLEDGSHVRPANFNVSTACMPNSTAKISLRKRQI